MLVLDRPIRRADWDRQVSERNGLAISAADEPAEKNFQDAGPWAPAVHELVGLQNLRDDWDGFGARAPSREILESAIGLAYAFLQLGVPPPHRVGPGVDGSVSFEWQYANGTYAEVEIDRPLHAEVMVIESGKPAEFWTLPTD